MNVWIVEDIFDDGESHILCVFGSETSAKLYRSSYPRASNVAFRALTCHKVAP